MLFVLFVYAACSALKISLHTSKHQSVTEGGVCYSLRHSQAHSVLHEEILNCSANLDDNLTKYCIH